VTYEKPYARTRDVLDFVKRALDGEKIDHTYETFEVPRLQDLASRRRSPADPARRAAPGMLRLAGREADGAILNWLGADDVAKCRGEVGADKMIGGATLRHSNARRRHRAMIGRRMISSYLTVNAYAEFHRWLGRG